MFIGQLKNSTYIIFLSLVMAACGVMEIKTVELDKPKYNWKYTDGTPSGGRIPKTNWNKNKYDNEKARFGILRELELAERTRKRLKEKEDATGRIFLSETQTAQLDADFNALQEEFDRLVELTPSPEVTAQLQELLIKINDLVFSQLKPLEDLLSKEVVVSLSADLSFQTGKFVLSQSAKQLIAEQIQAIEKDIANWRNYLNHHNEKVFSNDVYYVQANVVGYADEQGSKREDDRKKFNQELSEKRAEVVAIEFEKQIQKLSQRLNVKLIYLIDDSGKGEELPPGINDGPTDDIRRRICIVSAVTGPSSIFKKKN